MLNFTGHIEALEDIRLDTELLGQCKQQQGTHPARALSFHNPDFKSCATSCGNKQWPAISITGADCKLQCDHCKAKILEPMQAARTPDDLWRAVNDAVAGGARGMLLTGGSNHRNEVDYSAFYPTLKRIKTVFPQFAIAAHTALLNRDTAQHMEDAGIDTAMLDIIGAQDTISQVYHLKRPVADFEHSLACLADTHMRVVPHIVIGLHYGKLLGEWRALEILQRHRIDAAVLVVAMPFYAQPSRPFATPDSPQLADSFSMREKRCRTPPCYWAAPARQAGSSWKLKATPSWPDWTASPTHQKAWKNWPRNWVEKPACRPLAAP